MKIQVFSIHPLVDNRINRHIKTLLKSKYTVEYVNASRSKEQDFELKSQLVLHHIDEPFIKTNLKGVISAWHSMRIYLKKGNADIIHIHDPLLIPLFYYAKKLNKGTVYDKHESYEKIKGINARIGALFERIFIRYIDGIVYVNEQQRLYLDNITKKNKLMIPNYQSLEAYSVQKNRSDDNILQIIYIGCLAETTRNIMLMLDVMNEVLERCHNVKFIVGGANNDEIIKNKMQYLSNKFSNFEYKGAMKYSDVIETTVNSDIGLFFAKDIPNNQHSSPNKIYEYMIAGIPLVGMGNFMHADEIDGYAGKVFNFNVNRDEIVAYLISLIQNPNKIKYFKENAHNFGNKYTWESVEERYKEMYDVIQKKV